MKQGLVALLSILGALCAAPPAAGDDVKPLVDYLRSLERAVPPESFDDKIDSLRWLVHVGWLARHRAAVTPWGDTVDVELGWLGSLRTDPAASQSVRGALRAGKAAVDASPEVLAAGRQQATSALAAMLREGRFTHRREDAPATFADFLSRWWERLFGAEEGKPEFTRDAPAELPRWTQNARKILLVLIVLALFWPTIRDMRIRLRKRRTAQEEAAQADALSLAELRERAESAARQGDAREAIRRYMQWLLAVLSEDGAGAFRAGGTVRERLRGLQGASELVRIHESVVYGGVPAERAEAEAFAADADRLAQTGGAQE